MNQQDSRRNKRQPARQPVDLDSMVYGKLPPQSRELEEVILGAITLEAGSFDRAAEILTAECFYVDANQRIFRAFENLHRRNEPIDLLTVAEELIRTGDLETAGGAYYLTKVQKTVVSGANLVSHCRIVFQKYVKREMIRIAGEIMTDAFEDEMDVFDALSMAEQKISALAINKSSRQYKSLHSVAVEAVQQIFAAKENKSAITGVPSGIPKLDFITMGWQPTNLIIIAARPGVGKSAVAANIAIGAASDELKPTPTAIFSLEMGKNQYGMRMLSSGSKVPLFHMRRGNVTDQEMQRISEIGMIKFENVPVFLDDSPSLDIFELKSKARVMVLKEKIGLFIVDYLQLMGGSRMHGESREQEVGRISRELKQLAKELNVPIIALSQFSRAAAESEPRLSHLRESGSLEQDADDVLFLMDMEEQQVAQDASLKDSLLIRIAKHRNGTLEDVNVKFVKAIQSIMSDDDYHRYTKGGALPAASTWKPVGEATRSPLPNERPGSEQEMPF